MASTSYDPRFFYQPSEIVEEVEGIIRVYKDGRVERLLTLPNISVGQQLTFPVSKGDLVLENYNLRIRYYVPPCTTKQPVLLYFNGGGFCLGSIAWDRYHYFLARLCYVATCVILAVDYRLAPENRLPAAYEDGLRAIMWLRKQVLMPSDGNWWLELCNFSSFFIAGESSGANIAYNVVKHLGSNGSLESNLMPLSLKGIFLIQPFFGGEERKMSELYSYQPNDPGRSLMASDVYWRLALPLGANRDHPWCNPLAGGGAAQLCRLRIPSAMVIIAEKDYLRDRNYEFSAALQKSCQKVDTVFCKGVSHVFHHFHDSNVSEERKFRTMASMKEFIHQ